MAFQDNNNNESYAKKQKIESQNEIKYGHLKCLSVYFNNITYHNNHDNHIILFLSRFWGFFIYIYIYI